MQQIVRVVGFTRGSAMRYLTVPLIFIVLAQFSTVHAQPRFSVPLKASDGTGSLTLYFGIVPTANFCVVPSDSVNGRAEFFLPPVPPAGVFDSRFIWPRTGTNLACFDQGSLSDFRPYTSPTQRDSFRVKSQLSLGSTMVISWPAGLSARFTALTLRFIGSGGAVNTNMLTNTSVDVTDAGDPATVNIYSGGLVVSVEQTSTSVPKEFALNQNYPNPFNPSTTIRFAVESAARTNISVYDVLGRKVATLADEFLTPRFYSVQWNGTTNVGTSAASGVYFVQMDAQTTNSAKFSAIRKLLLMK